VVAAAIIGGDLESLMNPTDFMFSFILKWPDSTRETNSERKDGNLCLWPSSRSRGREKEVCHFQRKIQNEIPSDEVTVIGITDSDLGVRNAN